METTAKQIAQWAWAEIETLHRAKIYKNETALYTELAALADLSVSLIRQFHQRKKPNPSIETLDRMVSAVRAAKRLRAA